MGGWVGGWVGVGGGGGLLLHSAAVATMHWHAGMLAWGRTTDVASVRDVSVCSISHTACCIAPNMSAACRQAFTEQVAALMAALE